MRSDARYGTILVVDDNVAIRGLAEKFLERAGYSVATAADGSEGLRCYQEHQPSVVLLLTDVMMPNMNGLELAEHVLRIDLQTTGSIYVRRLRLCFPRPGMSR